MDTYQQTNQLLAQARSILICLPSGSNIDNITAGLALKLVLEADHKTVAVVGAGSVNSEKLKFLPNIGVVEPALPPLKQLIINVSTKNTPLREFSYRTKPESLEIYLEPAAGAFDPADVSIKNVDYKFDTIITIGAANLESLGEVFEKAPDFFYTTPLINIDHQPNNEHYGQINLISLTNVANSEVVYDLVIELAPEEAIDKILASLLLTGVMSETAGLKSSNLTPQILDKISQLIKHEVNVAEINKHLFHTKSLNMLKLWGRVLARLKESPDFGLVWSLVPFEDFTKTNTTAFELPQIVDELISTYVHAQIILLLWQNKDGAIKGLLKTTHHHNALQLITSFLPQGNASLAQFSLTEPDLLSAEQLIVNHLKQHLNKNST